MDNTLATAVTPASDKRPEPTTILWIAIFFLHSNKHISSTSISLNELQFKDDTTIVKL